MELAVMVVDDADDEVILQVRPVDIGLRFHEAAGFGEGGRQPAIAVAPPMADLAHQIA